MYLSLDPRGSLEPGRAVMDIIDGRPWIASRIRNNSLRQHCHMLGRTFRPHSGFDFGDSRALCRRLLSVVMARSGLLTEIHPDQLGTVPLLVRMAWYGKWWRRLPEEWAPEPGEKPQDQWRSLVRHLFCRDGIQLPAFFESAWLTNGTLNHMERTLYCHAAAGFVLRGMKDLPASMTRRALASFMRTPAHFTVRHALRRGQVKALGGSEELAREVIASRMAGDFSHDRIWLPLLEKMVAAPKRQPGDFGMIADLLKPLVWECRWERIDELLRLPFRDLQSHALRYWTGRMSYCESLGESILFPEVRRDGVRRWLDDMCSVEWPAMPAMPTFQAFPHGRWDWEIHQLTRHVELAADRREIKGGAVESCHDFLRGEFAVFSFRLGESGSWAVFERCFTVTVNIARREIHRIQSRDRSWMRPREAPVVREWALRNGLTSRWRD